MKGYKPKTVLAAVDFSDYSKVIAKQARLLAQTLKSKLVFVYVFPETATVADALEVGRVTSTDLYGTALKKFYSISPGEKILIRFGRPHQEIIRAARSLTRPLIVAGYRGQNAVARLFLGSTAEKLVLQSPFPVWIHKGQRTSLPKKILIPSDLSTSSIQLIEKIGPLKYSFMASQEIYHVMREPVPTLNYEAYSSILSAAIDTDQKLLKKFERKYKGLKSDSSLGPPGYKIAERSKKFDLTVVSPNTKAKRPPMARGVLEVLLRTAETPILVVPVLRS